MTSNAMIMLEELRMLRSHRLATKVVLASTLALTFATTALAADVYRWRQANGNLAFTDDEKRVPERYRAAAEKVSTGALAEYGRYSPVDGQAAAAHGERLAAHIERLRDLNARLDAMHGALDAAQIGAPAGAGDGKARTR